MLHSLSADHPSFQVRLYESLPTFRIVLIDQSIVSFSPYLMARGTERARTGWEAPHIVLDRTAAWPLASTFETLFEETWRTSKPLGRARRRPGELVSWAASRRPRAAGHTRRQRPAHAWRAGCRCGTCSATGSWPGTGAIPTGSHSRPELGCITGVTRCRLVASHDSAASAASVAGVVVTAVRSAWPAPNGPGQLAPSPEPGEQHGLGTGVHAPHQQVGGQPGRIGGPVRYPSVAGVDQLWRRVPPGRDHHVGRVQVTVRVTDEGLRRERPLPSQAQAGVAA